MIARRFQRFFFPRSIAVIGASRNPKKLGAVVARNIHAGGFRGVVYLVNPHARRIGARRCSPTIGALPKVPDLAVIATPADTVPAIVQECGTVGVKNCVVLSAGFSERNEAGEKLEADIRRLIERFHINLLGPNCLGFSFGENHLNASFGDAAPPKGTITLLSQSGAMAAAMNDWARASGVAFRALVSLGNKTGIDEVDMLEAFSHDEKTRALFLYLESMERGEAFVRVASRITRRIPVVVLKGGVSLIAQRAAATHTGALATSHRLVTAALAQAGCILAPTLESFFDLARLFSNGKPVGRRIAVLTNAGGPGIMAMEAISKTHLIPARVDAGNPLDVFGDADAKRFAKGLARIAASDAESVCVLLTRQVMTDAPAFARVLVRAAKRDREKRYVAVLLGGRPLAAAGRFLVAEGIPVFAYPEQAVSALAAAHVARPRFSYRPSPHRRLRLSKHGLLLSPIATRLLRKAGIAVTPEQFVRTEREALIAAKDIGYPVVLKHISITMPHKRRKGGIWLNLRSAKDVARALGQGKRRFKDHHHNDGWLLQPFRTGLGEYFIGARRDASFGPILLIGKGGSGVEEQPDISVVFPPFSIPHFVSSLYVLPAEDRLVVARAAFRLGRLLLRYGNVMDVDINPLFVTGARAEAGDVRIVAA